MNYIVNYVVTCVINYVINYVIYLVNIISGFYSLRNFNLILRTAPVVL